MAAVALEQETRSEPTLKPTEIPRPDVTLMPRPRRTGPRLDLLFLGDTYFGESYQAARQAKGEENVLETRGYDDAFTNLRAFLATSDLAIANLETPVTTATVSPFEGRKRYLHRADVAQAPLYLARNRVTAVSLANNHAFDFGSAGLEQTIAALDAHGVRWIGAGERGVGTGRPLLIEFGGDSRPLRIAIFAGYAAPPDNPMLAAGDCGVRPCLIDTDRIAADIAALRAGDPDMLVVAFPHWGLNYGWRSARQRTTGDRLLQAGVDLVLGHGAHRLQEIERRSGRWVVFGLGNFVYNSPGRYRRAGSPPFSLVARLVARPRPDRWSVSVRLYPIVSDNRLTDYRPRLATDAEFEQVRGVLAERRPHTSLSDGRDRHGRYLQLRILPGRNLRASDG
jgi:poly-gamma-glutamate capsule biosynthesis protein CapA/YwtB (metallophosphatase superfamily)